MGLESININITTDQKQFLSEQGNYSDFLRALIDEARGSKNMGLNELEAIRIEKQADLDGIDLKIADFIENQLQHKEELRQKEIEKYERKKLEQEQKEMEFKNRMDLLIGNEPEIQNFKFFDGWESTSNLIGLIELFRARNIRIGIFELRKYLASKPTTE